MGLHAFKTLSVALRTLTAIRGVPHPQDSPVLRDTALADVINGAQCTLLFLDEAT